MGMVCSKDLTKGLRDPAPFSTDNSQQTDDLFSKLKSDYSKSDKSGSTYFNQNMEKLFDISNFKEEPGPRDFELKIYHSRFKDYQIDYFNKEELHYYKNLLAEEGKTTVKKPKSKAINCQEDKLLGCGSFGTVTLGYDINNLRIMAVKRVYIGSSPEFSQALKEIEEESKLLSELQHKNIVTYYGSERDKEFLKIYMEFVDGGSIASLIKTYGPFSENIAARYTKQILEGLEYLHYHNVVHRDIKGANVLVTRNGIVKLSDFGSAKRICSYEKSMIGTIAWMAPEVIAAKGYNWFADIWSLGCTVFEMLTGKPPFWGNQVN